MLSIALLLSSLTASTAGQWPVLDGGFTLPRERSVAYGFACPDGLFSLTVRQRGGGFPAVTTISYAGHILSARSAARLTVALRKLRVVESASPRCLTNKGGIVVLLSGLSRNPGSHGLEVVTLRVDAKGHVSLN